MLDNEQYNKLLTLLPDNISLDLKEAFKVGVRFISLKKGEMLVEEHSSKQKVYYIFSGSTVRYVKNQNSDERAIMFHTETFLPIVGAIFVNINNSLVHYYIKANENTEVFEIEPAVIQKYGATDSAYTLFAIQTNAQVLATQNQIQNHLIGLSSEDFLKWFLKNYSFIFRRFSSKDIASFMNVTPTWLSLLKRNI